MRAHGDLGCFAGEQLAPRSGGLPKVTCTALGTRPGRTFPRCRGSEGSSGLGWSRQDGRVHPPASALGTESRWVCVWCAGRLTRRCPSCWRSCGGLWERVGGRPAVMAPGGPGEDGADAVHAASRLPCHRKQGSAGKASGQGLVITEVCDNTRAGGHRRRRGVVQSWLSCRPRPGPAAGQEGLVRVGNLSRQSGRGLPKALTQESSRPLPHSQHPGRFWARPGGWSPGVTVAGDGGVPGEAPAPSLVSSLGRRGCSGKRVGSGCGTWRTVLRRCGSQGRAPGGSRRARASPAPAGQSRSCGPV